MQGRAGATQQILSYAGIPFEHVSEMPQLAGICGAFGAESTTFAPPVVQDGDYTISQSTACAMYCGKK